VFKRVRENVQEPILILGVLVLYIFLSLGGQKEVVLNPALFQMNAALELCLVCVGSLKDVILPNIYIKVQITIVLAQWS
jgi:hypothetical protein